MRNRDHDLRKRIAQEAIDIVCRDGVDRITMRSLAGKLGYSPATIYLYFSSKSELLREIGDHALARLEEAVLPSSRIEDPDEALADLNRRYIRWSLANPGLTALISQELPWEEGVEGQPRFDKLWSLARDLHARVLEAHGRRGVDPELETAIGWAMISGLVGLVLAGRLSREMNLEELTESLIDTRRRGLR